MFTIRDATKAFFALDKTTSEKGGALDKSLRNLSQRIYLPAVGREGRADTYSLETICALRLLYKASTFGLDRWHVEKLAQFLQNADSLGNGRREHFSGGWRLLPPIEEAVQRVRAGEKFNIGMAMRQDGTVRPFTDWAPDKESDAQATDLMSSVAPLPEDVSISMPASRLIAELLSEVAN